MLLWLFIACADKPASVGETGLSSTTTPVVSSTGTTGSTTETTPSTTTTSTGCAEPVAGDDGWAVTEDGVLEVDAPGVLANDESNCPLTVEIVTPPSAGEVTLDAEGGLTYTPVADFNGPDGFVYAVTSEGGRVEAEVVIEVLPVNDPPVAFNDAYEVRTGETLVIPPDRGVLANDIDIDGDVLEVRIDPAGIPENGLWSLRGDGGIEYTSDEGFEGVERIAYRASDGMAESELAQALITVRP